MALTKITAGGLADDSVVTASVADSQVTLAKTTGVATTPYLTVFRLSANHTGDTLPLTNWEAPDQSLESTGVGSAVTHSSGVFTFPTTGFWWIDYHSHFQAADGEDGAYVYTYMHFTANNGSAWTTMNENATNMHPSSHSGTIQGSSTGGILFDCVATATYKVRQGFTTQDSGIDVRGETDKTFSWISFRRIGDT